MKVVNNVLELIGETPVIKLNRMLGADQAEVYVKLEGFNPGGSIKDRVAKYIIEEAIKTTRLLSLKEGLLVGTFSGANVCAALHLDNGKNRVITVLPDRAERYFSTALL